jgi:hypothetical protein
MVPRLPSAVLALVVVAPAMRADDVENPMKQAKVGDWVSYKSVIDYGTGPGEGTSKHVVTARDDKSLTLKLTPTYKKKQLAARENKIDPTKPFDPFMLANQGKKPANAKIEKVGEGKEKLELDGKTYECKWTKIKMTHKNAQSNEIVQNIKFWTCPDVPLGGLG